MRRIISLSSLRKMFKWKVSAWFVAIIIGVWWMMIPHHFQVAYFCIAAWTLIAAVSWLASGTLRRARPTSKHLKTTEGRKFLLEFRIFQFAIPAILLLGGGFAAHLTFDEQRFYELSRFNGVLYPADDADPPIACDTTTVPESALRFYLGSVTVFGEGKHAWILTWHRGEPLGDLTLLGIEKLPNNTLALDAHIVGADNKVIVEIDRNHFEINRNRILDSLSPPRPDLSTIVLKDEYGNQLKIRFMNRHSISFRGKLYYRPGYYVQFDDDGIELTPSGSIKGKYCLILSNPEGAGLLGVK